MDHAFGRQTAFISTCLFNPPVCAVTDPADLGSVKALYRCNDKNARAAWAKVNVMTVAGAEAMSVSLLR